MSKVTLTKIQRDAFREVIATGTTKAAESTVKALLRRNLIAPEGDGFAITKAGRTFLALDHKTDLTGAVAEGRKVAGRKDLPPVKTEAAKPALLPKDETPAPSKGSLSADGVVTHEGEKVADLSKAKPAPKTETVYRTKEAAQAAAAKATDKPKAAPVDKDATIRVAKQIRTFIAGHAVGTDPLAKRIAGAELAKDESVRIAVSDTELDVLRGWAEAMASGSTGRGEVRSARALIQWIDGMKARRAAKAK